jgi:N-terminal half of MaoC dehydratase
MAVEHFPIEASHILMFARAIGDENPAYTDASSDAAKALGGVIAPPTFTMASAQFDPDMVLRPKLDEPWFGSAATPSGAEIARTGALHAEQHFEYFRPVLAGEVLTLTERAGTSWTKTSKSGGSLVFEEKFHDYSSVDAGDVVVTARFVSVIPVPAPAPEA